MLEMREASVIRGGESRFMIYCATEFKSPALSIFSSGKICVNLWMNRWFEILIRLIHRLRRLRGWDETRSCGGKLSL